MKIQVIVLLIHFFIISCLCTSCNPAQDAYNSLVNLSERIDTKSAHFSQADWDDTALLYDDIVQTINRYDYSIQQQKQIDSLKYHCLIQIKQALQSPTK